MRTSLNTSTDSDLFLLEQIHNSNEIILVPDEEGDALSPRDCDSTLTASSATVEPLFNSMDPKLKKAIEKMRKLDEKLADLDKVTTLTLLCMHVYYSLPAMGRHVGMSQSTCTGIHITVEPSLQLKDTLGPIRGVLYSEVYTSFRVYLVHCAFPFSLIITILLTSLMSIHWFYRKKGMSRNNENYWNNKWTPTVVFKPVQHTL